LYLRLIATAALRVVSYNLAAVFSFATFLPSLAVATRRLHDTDRSGWWQLLYFFPVIGWVLLIIFCAEADAIESIRRRGLRIAAPKLASAQTRPPNTVYHGGSAMPLPRVGVRAHRNRDLKV